MGKRLEITVFGTLFVVGAIQLSRSSVQTGVEVFGRKKWHAMVGDIALGVAGKKVVGEVSNVLGHHLKPSFLGQGIAMQDRGFGFEVFHGGDFSPVDAVEARNRIIRPESLMEGFTSGDVLGVFWAQREDAMFYRWDDVDALRQEELTLVYDSLGPLMGKRKNFDLIVDVTWLGNGGRRNNGGKRRKLHSRQHALHKAR